MKERFYGGFSFSIIKDPESFLGIKRIFLFIKFTNFYSERILHKNITMFKKHTDCISICDITLEIIKINHLNVFVENCSNNYYTSKYRNTYINLSHIPIVGRN